MSLFRRQPRETVDHTTITESDLRAFESAGWTVLRGTDYVVVERGDFATTGHYEMRSFTVLGNGRYGRR